MRPVRAEHLPGIRSRRKFLLLNTALLWLSELRAAPARVGGRAGAPALPVELWARILALVDDVAPVFVPVVVSQDVELVDAGDGTVRVTLVEGVLSDDDGGGLTGETIPYFEELLRGSRPGQPIATRGDAPLYTFEGTAAPTPRTFALVIPAEYASGALERRTQWDWLPRGVLLFDEVQHPDCHARLGWDAAQGCRMCGCERFICPGCTGGMADEYDARMGCGVNLACPHCLGYWVCQDDKDYSQAYCYDPPPEEEERERRKHLVAALCTLGLADGRGWVYRDPADENKEEEQ